MISVLLSRTGQKSELASALERNGMRIFSWPRVEVAPVENQNALDEAIANLFGYDWLIFKRPIAADFFLKRLEELRHETCELDELRVCVLGEETASRLRESEVHVDIEVTDSARLFSELTNYAAGHDSLAGLNFLLPSAKVTREPLQAELDHAGARIDCVAAYRTTPEAAALTQLNALLVGGGIDSVFFRGEAEVKELAALFDTGDLSRILHGSRVICANRVALNAALEFGLAGAVTTEETAANALTNLIGATLESN